MFNLIIYSTEIKLNSRCFYFVKILRKTPESILCLGSLRGHFDQFTLAYNRRASSFASSILGSVNHRIGLFECLSFSMAKCAIFSNKRIV
jgi:hypothetical protein